MTTPGTIARRHSQAIIHKPCAFNPNGATTALCEEQSGLPRHNAVCCGLQCASPVRLCRACVLHNGGEKHRVANKATGLCLFHETNGENVVISAKSSRTISVKPALEARADLVRARRAVAQAKCQDIDPKLIRRNPNQPRKIFDPVELESLREGIEQEGQLQPGLIRPVPKDSAGTIYELVDGERRWRAVSQIPDRLYRTFVAELDDAAAYHMSVALNCNRVEHTHLEISDAIIYMGEVQKMKSEEIGRTMGIHPVIVSQYRSLQRIVPEVRTMLDPEQSGVKKFPFQAALYLSYLKPELQPDHARRYLRGELSAVQLKLASAEPELRSGDVNLRIPDIWEQWRSHGKRIEVLKNKLTDAIALMKKTRQPAITDSALTGREKAIAELRELKKLADEALAVLHAKP